MEYTYKGKDYPKDIKLNNPRIEGILSKPKGEFTFNEASWLLNLDVCEMREDCNALIMRELDIQKGKALVELKSDKEANPYVINNSLILLTGLFDDKDNATSDILQELLRQPPDFLHFNKIELGDDYTHAPIATAIYRCYCLSPELLIDLLLEKGISDEGKRMAADMIGIIGSNLKQRYEGANIEAYDELCQALKDVFNKHAKDYPNDDTFDRESLSYLVDTISTIGMFDISNQLPLAIEHLFHSGYIDKDVINEEDALDGLDGQGWDCEEPVRDVRELLLPKVSDD